MHFNSKYLYCVIIAPKARFVMKIKHTKKVKKLLLKIGRSKIGLGLFALENIKKGDFIIEYIGKKLNFKQSEYHQGRYLFEVYKHLTIDGSTRKNKARYINHSCKPNCEPITKKGRVFIYAIKNIKSGEELNYDYGKEYFDGFFKESKCLCGFCDGKGKKIKSRIHLRGRATGIQRIY